MLLPGVQLLLTWSKACRSRLLAQKLPSPPLPPPLLLLLLMMMITLLA
jgi:hypothetical protein